MIKYILHPGPVKSRWDGDIHLISASRLAELYNVNLSECIIYGRDTLSYSQDFLNDLTPLFPQQNGNYILKNKDNKC